MVGGCHLWGVWAKDWTADVWGFIWALAPALAPAPGCAFAFAFFMATITFHRFTFGRFGRVCCMLLVCVLYLAYGAYITAESTVNSALGPVHRAVFGICGKWRRLSDCR